MGVIGRWNQWAFLSQASCRYTFCGKNNLISSFGNINLNYWSFKASFTLTKANSVSLVNLFLELGLGLFVLSNQTKGFKSTEVSFKCGHIQLISPNNFWKSFKVSKQSLSSLKGTLSVLKLLADLNIRSKKRGVTQYLYKLF